MTERAPNIRDYPIHPAMSGELPVPGFRAALSRLLRKLFGD